MLCLFGINTTERLSMLWIVGKVKDRQFNYAKFLIYALNNQANTNQPPPTMDLFGNEHEMFLLHFKDIFTSFNRVHVTYPSS